MTLTPFYEFFSGGGMARLGLGEEWRCILSNEWSEKKASSYIENFPDHKQLVIDDICNLAKRRLEGNPRLAWASFPCQDLSLAGKGIGLNGGRSGMFWPFWEIMMNMKKDNRQIPVIVIENVVGAITSNNGSDFSAITNELAAAGYHFGPLIIDAAHFVPQSRPRLFIVAVAGDIPDSMISRAPSAIWHPENLRSAYDRLSTTTKNKWIWWNLPMPPVRATSLDQVVEDNPVGVTWHTKTQTQKLLSMMSKSNLAKVDAIKSSRKAAVGAVYKRTRLDSTGQKVQRAEVRFDGVSGCLRTPAGGSSRQILLIVDGQSVRSRLISPRELARLMGLPESYRLPARYNDAYHLIGDGLAVPAVRWLENALLQKLLPTRKRRGKKAA